MKLFTGWAMAVGLVVTAAGANAQVPAPYQTGQSPYMAASDVSGPYAAMPPEAQDPRYQDPRYQDPRYGEPRYGVPRYGPMLLPPTEVYTIVRESGFSPLGIPRQRGLVYTIAVIDRRGDDGRLVIDARTGRVLRFMPAYRMGNNYNDDVAPSYRPGASLPPMNNMRGEPRPPASVPRVASRTPPVPMPKPTPPHAGEVKPEAQPQAATPEPAKQSAAVQAKPADVPTTPPSAVPIVEAKPAAPQIKPTQEMPKAQGLD